MIDLHILTIPSTSKSDLSKCLKSIEAEETFTLHMVDGVVGNIGLGRARGFSKGANPYVTFADPDDELIPGIGKHLIRELDREPGGVIPKTSVRRNGKHIYYQLQHGLPVFRREDVEPYLELLESTHWVPERMLIDRIQPVSIHYPGYIWNIGHKGQAHKNVTMDLYKDETLRWSKWLGAKSGN